MGRHTLTRHARGAVLERRRFDDDFKAQPVRLVLDEGKSVGAEARDLDLTVTALREWVQSRPRRSHSRPARHGELKYRSEIEQRVLVGFA